MDSKKQQPMFRDKKVLKDIERIQKKLDRQTIKNLNFYQSIIKMKGSLSIIFILGEEDNLRLSYIAKLSYLTIPTARKVLKDLVSKKIVSEKKIFIEYPRKEKIVTYSLTIKGHVTYTLFKDGLKMD